MMNAITINQLDYIRRHLCYHGNRRGIRNRRKKRGRDGETAPRRAPPHRAESQSRARARAERRRAARTVHEPVRAVGNGSGSGGHVTARRSCLATRPRGQRESIIRSAESPIGDTRTAGDPVAFRGSNRPTLGPFRRQLGL